MRSTHRAALLATVAVSGAIISCRPADAGGFAIREQSATFQGMSYAGNAAGGALSSMFWNPAATATFPGLNTESSYTLILPDSKVTVHESPIPSGLFPNSSDIGDVAFASGTYGAYQLSGYDPNLFIGVAINGPFGLLTEPKRENYEASVLGRTTRLFTLNVNPTVAYRIAPGLVVGGGAQIQYADAALKFATGAPNGPNTFFQGDDVAFGGTAGILWSPAIGTSLGLGWRSQLTHTIDGTFGTAHTPLKVSGETEVNLPDVVTFSVQQAVSPVARIMGTVEWSSWSRFDKLTVKARQAGITALNTEADPITLPGQTIATIPTNWSDGWFFALGGEYDYSPRLTFRAGGAYGISPVDEPEKRVVGIPDSNRIWASGGASYKWSEWLTVDLAYTHIFFEDASFVRSPVGSTAVFAGDVNSSADLITVGFKTKWGGEPPLEPPLK